MTSTVTLLTQLHPSITNSRIMVRTVRAYESFTKSGKTKGMDWVFHDREGTRIHGYVRSELADLFRHSFNEGDIYFVDHMVVEQNIMFYYTTHHIYKVRFSRSTVVSEALDDSFPNFMYNFKAYESLKKGTISESTLIDVIGKVIHMKSPQQSLRQGVLAKFIDLTLQDLNRKTIGCRLWANEVDRLLDYQQEHLQEPIVLILKLAKVGFYEGVPTVSNTYFVSQVIYDPADEEIKDFTTRQLVLRDGVTGASSQVEHSEATSVEEQLRFEFKCVSELRNCPVGKYYVVGSIKAVDWRRDWSFIACVTCKRMATQRDKNSYMCNTCNIANCNTVRRYRLEVTIGDGIVNENAVMWDRESWELLGMSANALREKAFVEARLEDPTLFNPMIGKEELFVIEVKGSFEKYFTVCSIISDPTIKNSCMKALPTASQDSDLFSAIVKSGMDQSRDENDSDEVTTPLKPNNPPDVDPKMKGKMKCKRVLEDDMSVTAPKNKQRSVLKIKDNDTEE